MNDINELLGVLTPLTLTTAINNIRTNEPFVLKSRLCK